MKLHIVPIEWPDACEFIGIWHRHHSPPQGHKFSLGVATPDGILRGVATVGRPVGFARQDGLTLEVTRTATDGTKNANSCLYGACWRAAKALGYERLGTYTQANESGASLKAAGWHLIAERKPRGGWDSPSRPRDDDPRLVGVPRRLWEAHA